MPGGGYFLPALGETRTDARQQQNSLLLGEFPPFSLKFWACGLPGRMYNTISQAPLTCTDTPEAG